MRKIVKSITVNIQSNKAYNLWTTRDGLNKFFGEDSKIELVKNGPFEIYFSMSFEEGMRGSEGCKIIDFKENNYLKFTWNVPPSFKDQRTANYHSIVTINFREIKDNKTELKLINEYNEDIDKLDEIINYFDKAWDYVLSSFVKMVNSL